MVVVTAEQYDEIRKRILERGYDHKAVTDAINYVVGALNDAKESRDCYMNSVYTPNRIVIDVIMKKVSDSIMYVVGNDVYKIYGYTDNPYIKYFGEINDIINNMKVILDDLIRFRSP